MDGANQVRLIYGARIGVLNFVALCAGGNGINCESLESGIKLIVSAIIYLEFCSVSRRFLL